MRIISNNKTDDYNNYLERKKGILNYNNILISKPQIYNNKTNNFTINSRNKIVRYKSYELVKDIKNIKPYFNNKCFPNNKIPKQTLDLTGGKTSNFNMENIIINTEIFNDTSCNSDCIFGNNLSNLTYNIKNNYVSNDCIMNYILKNIGNINCPTILKYAVLNFNNVFLNGSNDNEYVDKDGELLFSNLKRYNTGVKFGFTVSGQSLPLSEVNQYNRITLSINDEQINKVYITNEIFTNSWDSSDIAFSNSQLNFTNQSNNIIFPEFHYAVYDYFIEFEGKGCIKKEKINGKNYPLIDLSFSTRYPTREEVNKKNYNILLSQIDAKILENDFSFNDNNLNDFSYHHLIWKPDSKLYNVIFAKNIDLQSNNKLLSFVILKDYKIYVGKTGVLSENQVGKDLSGNLCYFSLNIQNASGNIIYNQEISSTFITGYDENFDTQSNPTFYSDLSLNMNISKSIDTAVDPNNIDYSNQVNIEKIKGYYLGLDISNIEVINIPLKDLCLNNISSENITNKFSIKIQQYFPDDGSDISTNLNFIVNKAPENQIDVNGEISFLSYNFTNLNSSNYFFGINFIDLNNVDLILEYNIDLSNLTSDWIFNDYGLGKIDVSINFSFNNSYISSFRSIKTISIDSNELYDISTIIYDLSFNFNIGNITSYQFNNNNFSLGISSNIIYNSQPIYNFSNITPHNREIMETINKSDILILSNNFTTINTTFNYLFKINFRQKDNIDYDNKEFELVFCNPGNYEIIANGSYVNWSDFLGDYDQTKQLKDGQLLWSINAFITKNSNTKIDEEINYINYSNYFGNQNINYKSLENSGNLIISQTIDYYWNKDELLDFQVPRITQNYKFITLKINLEDRLYLSNIILITCSKIDINKNYLNLKLVEDFILYVCEENTYYDMSNSGYPGRSAWMNAAKEYDTQSFRESVKNGGGCYNPYADYYQDKDNNDYELYIPLLNTRSSSAIYLKIGLPVNSNNNIAKVNYKLPEYIN